MPNLGLDANLEGLTLHVRDVERACAFYEQIPGFRLVAHRPGEFALLKVGRGLLGLLQMPKSGFHVEIGVTDLDGMWRRLVTAGLAPASEPKKRPWGERTFNLTDPDGYVLEIQEGD